MDSITQAALGASVAYAVAGKSLGSRALIYGAVLGSLPDMDVLVPYEDAVDNFTYHRSWSHSFITLSVFSVALFAVSKRWWERQGVGARGAFLLLWLVLVTHPLLDSFTVYGTQVWWPISRYPVGWGSIFIIDPFYTIPLLIAIVFIITKDRADKSSVQRATFRAKAVYTGLLVSSFYLLATILVQKHVEKEAVAALSTDGIKHNSYVALPTPGLILWRIVARDTETYFEGFYSLLKPQRKLQFERFPTHETLLESVADEPAVLRLRSFTKGLYASAVEEDYVLISDLRMGIEAQYVFRFRVARISHDTGVITPLKPTQLQRFQPNIERMKWVLQQY